MEKKIKSKKQEIETFGKPVKKNVKGAESKTWSYKPNPYYITAPDATALAAIRDMTFTIVRAPLSTGGYRCYMTFNSYWESAMSTNSMACSIDLFDAENGFLLHWDVGVIKTECGWTYHGISYSKDFDPDIYDIISKPKQFFGGAYWKKC